MKSTLFPILAACAAAFLATGVPARAQDARLSTVVIDPGHGGTDPGCISRDGKTQEKTVALDISQRLSDMITAAYPAVKVVMTRSDDTYISLPDRGKTANEASGDLFISIHVNAVEKGTTARGFSIHCLGQSSRKGNDLFSKNLELCKRENSVIKLDENQAQYQGFDPEDTQSYIFFSLIQNSHLEQSLIFAEDVATAMADGPIGHSRGVSQDPFYVLWTTAMPSVLIEVGFMTNPDDLATLRTEKGRDGIARSIFRAFTTYKARYDHSVGAVGEEPVADKNTGKETAETAAPAVIPSEGVCYGVQILAIGKKMDLADPYFQGYVPTVIETETLNKYVVGVSTSQNEAKKNLKSVKKKFPDAYLVKIENGNTTPVK